MRLKYLFETINMDDEVILVPVGKNSKELQGVVRLNKEGLEIINMLEDNSTEDHIVEILSSKYSNDNKTLVEYVHSFIEKLRNLDLIDD